MLVRWYIRNTHHTYDMYHTWEHAFLYVLFSNFARTACDLWQQQQLLLIIAAVAPGTIYLTEACVGITYIKSCWPYYTSSRSTPVHSSQAKAGEGVGCFGASPIYPPIWCQFVRLAWQQVIPAPSPLSPQLSKFPSIRGFTLSLRQDRSTGAHSGIRTTYNMYHAGMIQYVILLPKQYEYDMVATKEISD